MEPPHMSSEKYHVALATDNKYVPYAAAVIASALKHAGQNDSLCFHIIADGVEEKQKESLRSLKALHGKVEFEFITPNVADLPKIKLTISHISRASLFRLQLPELLKGCDKIIYLDCDTIVLDSLKELWKTDLSNSLMAGVCDYNGRLTVHNTQLGITKGKYINSGVLVMNLRRMREEKISEKFMDTAASMADKLTMGDQDIINIALQGKIKCLDLRWNLSSGFFKGDYPDCPYSRTEICEAIRKPGIIHYTSARKPWTFKTPRHPLWEHYFDAVRDTKFSSEFKRMIKKHVLPKAIVKGPGADALEQLGLK